MPEKIIELFTIYVAYIAAVFMFLLLRKKEVALNPFREKNLIFGAIILLGVLIFGYFFGAIAALALFFFIYVGNEIFVFFLGRDLIWDKDSATRLFYGLPGSRDISNDASNKSEACYDETYSTPKGAQENKFKKIIELLELKPGHRLLDIGCGEGELLQYCQNIGIKATGLTLVRSQAERARKRGLDVQIGSFHNFFKIFENQYDAVIFLGSLEHAVPNGHHPRSKLLVKLALNEIFLHASRYLDIKSPIRKIFVSILHLHPKYYGTFSAFLVSRTQGGAYPCDNGDEGISNYEGQLITHISDHTKDYYLATVNQSDHFGHTHNGNIFSYLKALLLFPIYPLILYFIIYDVCGYWMWQFDGKLHFKRDYTFVDESLGRPVSLYWTIIKYPNE